MEIIMIKLKQLSLLIIFVLIFGCGGSNGDKPDYSTFTDSDMLALANQYKANGNYQIAIDHYKRLLLEFPTSNLHIKAQLSIAECYAGMDKWEEQFATLERLITENIIPEQVPQIYIQIGRFYERAAQFNPGVITTDSMDYNLAMDYFDKALKYPDSDDNRAKSESVYRRALVEAKIGRIDDAVARYKMVSNLFPKSDFSILAQMKLRDPQNINELVTTDSALTRYKQVLGLIESDGDLQEEVIEKPKDQELESTIDALDSESQEPSGEEFYQENPSEDEDSADENYYPEQPADDQESGEVQEDDSNTEDPSGEESIDNENPNDDETNSDDNLGIKQENDE